MFIASVIGLLLGFLLFVGGGIWLTVNAFSKSVWWGLGVLLVPFVWLLYVITDWAEAKGSFVVVCLGCLFLGGGLAVLSQDPDARAKMFQGQLARVDAAPPGREAARPKPVAERTRLADQGIFKAKKDAELQIRLVNLRTRETDLRDRKAALHPGDKAGTAALAEEIRKYNADLQPLLEEMKQHPQPAP